MRKIIDEVYMTVNSETDTEWTIQYSSQIYKEKCGFFNGPKLFNQNEKLMCFVGAAHYMFVFEENGQTGTMICLLEDSLFALGNEMAYNERIEELRQKVLSGNPLK